MHKTLLKTKRLENVDPLMLPPPNICRLHSCMPICTHCWKQKGSEKVDPTHDASTILGIKRGRLYNTMPICAVITPQLRPYTAEATTKDQRNPSGPL